VTAALRLFQSTPALNWTVACSEKTARLVSSHVKLGKRTVVEVPGHAMSFEVLEVVSLRE
jgi:hypothetical protein